MSQAASCTFPTSPIATPLLILRALLALTPMVSAAVALIAGAAIALLLGNPIHTQTHTWTHRLLPLAVVGLGAEMNLGTVARVGLHGLGYTAVSLTLVMGLGLLLGEYLKVDRDAREALKAVGFRPFLQGLLLWLIVGSLGLGR